MGLRESSRNFKFFLQNEGPICFSACNQLEHWPYRGLPWAPAKLPELSPFCYLPHASHQGYLSPFSRKWEFSIVSSSLGPLPQAQPTLSQGQGPGDGGVAGVNTVSMGPAHHLPFGGSENSDQLLNQLSPACFPLF